MKKKLLHLFTLRVAMLVALLATAVSGAWAEEITDELTSATLSTLIEQNISSSWAEFDYTGTSGAVYHIRTMKPSSGAMQWNTNAYLYVTTSGGKLKSVTVNGTSGKSVEIFGANTAYSAKASQTSVNTLSLTGSDATYTFSSNYTFLAINGKASSTTITSLKVVWESSSTPTCATPTFSPAAGAVTEGTEVTISTSTNGATIYYTTDGNNPTAESTQYTGPITINEATTIKAIAVKEDYDDSQVATAAYTIKAPVSGYTVDFENDLEDYVDWTFSGIGIHTSGVTSAHGGKAWGSNVNESDNAVKTAYIQTKEKVAYPDIFTCYISKESSNSTSSTWKIQISSDGSSWTDIATTTSMTQNTWTEFSGNIKEKGYTDVYVRLYYDGSNAKRAVDDINLTTYTSATLSSLDITSAPTKLSYLEGDSFDFTGMVVTGTYDDESEKDVTSKATLTATPSTLAAATTSVTVTATLDGKEVSKEYTVTVAERQKYTVTFDAGTGSCSDASLTESTGGSGITLPTATHPNSDWTFCGWATAAVSETTTAPTLLTAESTYKPTENITLYAVYSHSEGGSSSPSVTIAEYAAANSWGSSSSESQKTITINSDVTATCNTGTNSGKYYNDGWRIYQNETGKVTITTTSGTLTSVKFTFTVDKTGTLNYNSSAITSGTAVEVSGKSAEFTLGNSGSVTNGQVKITAIEVTYSTSTTTYNSNPSTVVLTASEVAFANEAPSIDIQETKTFTQAATAADGYDGTITYELSDNTCGATIEGTTVTVASAGAVTVTATAPATETYKASTATYTLTVTDSNAPGTVGNPYTVAEAIAAIDAADKGTINNVYVKGIVSQVDSYNSNYSSITYWISDDGTTTNQFEVYSGKGIDGAAFESVDDVQVGDVVVVTGNITYFTKNSVYEFAQSNQLVKLTRKPTATISFAEESYTVGLSGTVKVEATSDSGADVTYSSGDATIAEVNAETGVVTPKKEGTVQIIATVAENGTHKGNTNEVTLTVTDDRTPVVSDIVLGVEKVAKGAEGKFTATATKADDVTGDVTYTYESKESEILFVLDDEYVGSAVGTAHITVTATPAAADQTKFKAVETTFDVVVTDATTLTLSADDAEDLPLNTAYVLTATLPEEYDGELTATVTPAAVATATIDGNTITITPKAQYSDVASVTVTASAGTKYYTGTASEEFSFTVEEATAKTTAPVGGFTKVTSTSDLTEGQYLIVYEGGNVAFNGGLESLDAVSNTIAVTISDNKIAASAETEAAVFTVAVSGESYTIKSASGNYIGKTADSNGLDAKTTELTNTISFDENGNANIVGSGGAYLRYNSDSGSTRFRYYKSSTYSGQKAIALYKLATAEPITATLNASGLGTFASEYPLDFSDDSEVSAWQITDITEEEDVVTLEFDQIKGIVAGGTGVLLKGEGTKAGLGTKTTVDLTSDDYDAETAVSVTKNLLTGVFVDTYVDANTYFGLSGQNFVKVKAGVVNAGKALLGKDYIDIATAGEVKSFRFVFNDSETGITETRTLTPAEAAEIFDMGGRRLMKMQKGVNIVGGKKILVK